MGIKSFILKHIQAIFKKQKERVRLGTSECALEPASAPWNQRMRFRISAGVFLLFDNCRPIVKDCLYD
jgi:hypothetical protein